MKIKVVGMERMEGISKDQPNKPGKAYAIGRLHAIVRLDDSRNGEKSNAVGYMGTTYEVEVPIIRKLEGLPLPFDADMVIEDVIRFGKREGKVMEVRPLSTPTLKAA